MDAEYLARASQGQFEDDVIAKAYVNDQDGNRVHMTSTLTILQEEYDRLKKIEAKMDALIEAGVDNWEGYGEAMSELYRDSLDE